MKAPAFWQRRDAPLARLLAPAGWLYAAITAWRLTHGRPWKAPVPVVCVGNLTAGGAGKTPIVRDLAARLAARGRRPGIVSRGYGGRADGPVRVDPALHTARQVGDEPLLLAGETPCWVATDRAAGARAMVLAGIDVIVMDDGLQNPGLVQDLRLIVVDGAGGFGNGRPLPAGPLRETIRAGLKRADALIVMGDDATGLSDRASNQINILRARVRLRQDLPKARLLAFAGIGRPEKFQLTLTDGGADIAEFHGFADHHHYTGAEMKALSARAGLLGARLVTTEKDWVRTDPEWRRTIEPIAIDVAWQDEAAVTSLLDTLLGHG